MVLSVINKFSYNPLFVLGAYAGLFLPDIDLLLLPILHHRSIITHSVFFVLFINKFVSKDFSQGLLLGVGCHLLADSTGSMVGFGMIWLPIIIIPIGPVLSLIWILGNAFMCLYIFYTNEPINKILFLMVVIGTLGISMITAGTATYALVIIGLVGLLSNYKKYRNSQKLP